MQLQERRQIAAILAGLRLLQVTQSGLIKGSLCELQEGISDIANSSGDFEPLNADEIDALCMDINLGDIELVSKVAA